MKRVHDSISRIFSQHRLVFWYDPAGEWPEAFASYTNETVTKLVVENNEFGTKVRVVRDPNPDAKFLIYLSTARPADSDNWLLDLLLQGYEYKADKASLAIQEAGLSLDFHHLAEEHAAYFQSTKRVQALRDLVGNDDQSRDLKLKMMSVLAGTDVGIESILLRFLSNEPDLEGSDPVSECFTSANLVDPFWKEVERLFGYASLTPSLRDFVVSLFSAANPLDLHSSLRPSAKVFLQRWKDSKRHNVSFRAWSERMEHDLQIASALDSKSQAVALADWDTFEIFEKFTLHRLCQAFVDGSAGTDLRAVEQERRASFWWPQHEHGYAALRYAVELRELLGAADLNVDSIVGGIEKYTKTWWRIDTAYRLCSWNLRRYGQVQVMEQVSQWVEKSYVNNFLLPLADRWSDLVRDMACWQASGITAQRNFFERYVQPFLNKGSKVFVIISDALRYEAGADLAGRLRVANRWTAEVEAMLSPLPSYTQLGMAQLLPGRQWTIDGGTAGVMVDGKSAQGTANRSEILNLACGGRAIGLQADEFIEMNAKVAGRALMRDHDVIYIFHNVIDKTGDASSTEVKTFNAVEQAFEEIEQIIKRVATINGSNMLLTADHGFLFQQDHLNDDDLISLPAAGEWTFRNRRFAFGQDIEANPQVKVFESTALGLTGDWSAAFPLSLGRFPLQGSGKRYVHGGASLQEVIVPVVRIHKARSDDTERVEIIASHVPPRITTGNISIVVFQEKAALGKVLPRTLRIGVFAHDGTALSELKTITFDSKQAEARQRETKILLALSHSADSYNNQGVEVRLEETIPGTSKIVTYKSHPTKMQKSFTLDFE